MLVLMFTVLASVLMVMALGVGAMLVSMGMLVLMFMFMFVRSETGHKGLCSVRCAAGCRHG